MKTDVAAQRVAEDYRLAFPDERVDMCRHYAYCCKPDDVVASHWLVMLDVALAALDQHAWADVVESDTLAESLPDKLKTSGLPAPVLWKAAGSYAESRK
ncbi:MAG: hypothetical protein R8M45_08175 [Ghiorsea sp.]